ncbi:MAG: hypothetical protein IPJ88_09200 [Myxococcales bacterium]|nr:MAG: hypothetical protein IPJ88_09200 [Myxococcales bacterium]
MPLLIQILVVTLTLLLGVKDANAGDHNDEALCVIASETTKLSSVSHSLLRDIFIANPNNAPSGVRIRPFNLPAGNSIRVAFDRAVLNMSPEEAGRFWVDQKIRGNARSIRTIPSLLLLEKVIAKIPGAISYIPLKYYRGKAALLTVDKYKCGQPGYPLRMPNTKAP